MKINFKSIMSATFICISFTFAAFLVLNSYAQNDNDKAVGVLQECVQILEKYRQHPDTLSKEELEKALRCLESSKKPPSKTQKPTTIFRSPEKN